MNNKLRELLENLFNDSNDDGCEDSVVCGVNTMNQLIQWRNEQLPNEPAFPLFNEQENED